MGAPFTPMRTQANNKELARELEQVRGAHRALEKVRRQLLRPSVEGFDVCATDLNQAVQCLERLQNTLAQNHGHAAPPVLAAEIKKLRAELKAATSLVAGAGRFYAGWARLIASDDQSPNYSSKGQAGVPIPINSAGVVMHG